MKSGIRQFLQVAAATVAVTVLVVAGLGLADWWRIGHVPAPCDRASDWTANLALVLSGGQKFHRTLHAVALFKAGRVDRLAFSGAGNGGDSGVLLGQAAQRAGVPEYRITVEPNAHSTYQNFRYICVMPRLVSARRIAIVTDQWHALRSYLTAIEQCSNRVFCSAPAAAATSLGRRNSEAWKLLRYQLLGWAAWW